MDTTEKHHSADVLTEAELNQVSGGFTFMEYLIEAYGVSTGFALTQPGTVSGKLSAGLHR
jgi:bacteriocin-like protein